MVSADIQYMTGVEEHTKRVITCKKMFGKGRHDYKLWYRMVMITNKVHS